MTNFFKRRKTINVGFDGIVAKVYVSKSKGTSKYSVDLWLFNIKFLAKIVVEDDDYKGVLEEAGISNIIVI
ncbi:MAG: hypothetical protein J6126_00395 [Clostridia bacterium]|nr:hypothetical protein [Clostridia bacterium]